MPSTRNRLARLRAPWKEGNEKAPTPRNPKVWAVLTGLAPGVSASNCVKFRPFNGRSLTWRVAITVPSSAVEFSIVGATACTVTVCSAEPTLSVKSKVAD